MQASSAQVDATLTLGSLSQTVCSQHQAAVNTAHVGHQQLATAQRLRVRLLEEMNLESKMIT